MTQVNQLFRNDLKIGVVGLGYVGLPLAVAFSKFVDVVGFDINKEKIDQCIHGIDTTNEVGNDVLKKSKIKFTSNEIDLKSCNFIIVAVPTPVNVDHTPNLYPLESASEIVGRNLDRNTIVVYESTVYPGVTEEVCVPILERESGLECIKDFKVGYSPERINPGDKEHRLESIVKIVSGIDAKSLELIANTYSLIIEAGVFKAETIKIAEAAKVIENSQRDINIAFMNELSIIFNKMGIDTNKVLEAASTKWNFLKFTPGLVGGHCIGVDPYYLTYKAELLGYNSQIILSGRRINDGMGKYIAENLVKSLINTNINVKDSNVAIFGFTFKENCPDTRNTKVIDIIRELNEYGVKTFVYDSYASQNEMLQEYSIRLSTLDDLKGKMDAVLIAVKHDEFLNLKNNEIDEFYKISNSKKILFDIKSIFNVKQFETENYKYWNL